MSVNYVNFYNRSLSIKTYLVLRFTGYFEHTKTTCNFWQCIFTCTSTSQ